MNDALITAGGVALGFVARSLWDVYWKRTEERRSVARQKRLEFIERQLSQFYWPLYLHLQKNNVLWEHLVNGSSFDQDIKSRVDLQLQKFFLPNHDEILKIIQGNIYLARADEAFEQLILRFIRHVAIFKALREVGLTEDPIAIGEPWPVELFPAVQARTRRLQEAYDAELGAAPLSPNNAFHLTSGARGLAAARR